jgi:hypothetical protein
METARDDRGRELAATEAAATAARVAGEEGRVTLLLAEIERAKGPASRRAVTQRALSELSRQDARERLLVGAAKIETRLVLEKVDSLKSKAARRRNIEEGLATLHELHLPDHIRRAEIAVLESARKELGEP